jgi:hypothetical protein
MTLLKVAKIRDLRSVPKISSPDHVDTQIIMFMYTMESFLYTKINKVSRDKDASAIKTLGPFTVALTRIINEC